MDSDLPTLLLRTLRVNGPMGGGELQAALGVSQPTFSRAAARCAAALVTHGRARAARYGAAREVPTVSRPLSVYALNAEGRAARLTQLVPVAPRGWLAMEGSVAGWYDDLPWFLQDLRPVGFLGRLAQRQAPELRLPADVRDWPGDDVVRWAVACGADLPGNLLLGDTALNQVLSAPSAERVHRAERTERYPELAARVLAGEPVGSSAGGEQPKFLATRIDSGERGETSTPVLVKFSPPMAESVGTRVADLLVAEHLALTALREAGQEGATTRLLRAGGRMFLEVERFDRVGALGRRGVVSLAAVGAHFTGDPDGWTAACARLCAEGVIDAQTVRRARWLDRFGALIGNTDRHPGNLSFYIDSGRVAGLAPAYDMLPMRWYPRNAESPTAELVLPTLDGTEVGDWQSTGAAALQFWCAVATHPMVSSEYSAVAAESARKVDAFCALAGRLVG